MTYDVQFGSGGYIGWKILERTMERQREAFDESIQIRSTHEYFSNNISKIKTVDDLVSDYKMLSVALRAFGLDADIGNKFFIKKVLESDPKVEDSFVNRLSDKRYLKLNQAFMSDNLDKLIDPNVAEIVEKYKVRSFEKNIGKTSVEIELSLNAKREVKEIADSSVSENAKWYQILGSKPLRGVFEVAFNLGESFSTLPIDRQLSEIKNKSEKYTGSDTVGQFSSPDSLESLIKTYLLRNQIKASATNNFSIALTLLRA